MNERRILNALLRLSFPAHIERCFLEINPGVPFLPNWHIEAIAHALERCMRGEIRRLLITLPPRSLKSLCASVAFPTRLLGIDPASKIICVSYADELAVQFARWSRKIMTAPWYISAFPSTRLVRSPEHHLQTSRGGGRYATSTGGSLTGIGGDFIIIDDPQKALDAQSEALRRRTADWFATTLLSRLNNKSTGVIILVMQRVHMDDLAGQVLATGQWEHLDLPAIAEVPQTIALPGGRHVSRIPGDVLHPARESREDLDRMRRELGEYHFVCQYQQRPIPAAGNLIRWDWMSFVDAVPERTGSDRVYQSWDMALMSGETNSYSVCTTWLVRGDSYYLLDLWRQRADFPTLRERVIALATQWSPDKVLIENTAAGAPILQELRRTNSAHIRLEGVTPKGDKTARVSAVSNILAQGHVYLPREAAWLSALRDEMLAFPFGAYDDQVDSITQFLQWHTTRNKVRLVRLRGL